jgi:hypothetical protein
MKNRKTLLALVALSTALTLNMQAQGRGQGRGQGQGRGPQAGFGGPQGGPPLFAALDTNKDGELSAAEIKNAAAVMKKLDSNGDGKLTIDEIRPRRVEAGPGRGGNEGRRRGPGGPGGDGGQRIDRLMEADANGDGKVSKDELPERMQRLMERMDTNKDGFITRDEAEKASASFGNRGGQGRGQGQSRGQGQRQRPRSGRQ